MELIIAADAADVDSFVCLQLLLKFWHKRGSEAVAWLPIARAELSLRSDIVELQRYLSNYGWHDGICYADELNKELLLRSDLHLHLVDRHTLPALCTGLERRVATILDHRPDSGSLAMVADRQIKRVASCATLLWQRAWLAQQALKETTDAAQLILNCWASLLEECSRLLLAAAIGLDSEWLLSEQSSDADRQALAWLERSLSLEQWQWLQSLLSFRYLSSSLSAAQQLYQDLKWVDVAGLRVPIAVLQSSAEQFWALTDASVAVASLQAEALGAELLLLHKPPRPALRQLSIVCSSPWPARLVKFFDWPQAKCRSLPPLAGAGVRLFELGNSALSRKDVLFRMEQILTGNGQT